MSYLDDAVYEISTGAGEGAAFYEITPTEQVSPTDALAAQRVAERYYRREARYDGPLHSVAQERADGVWAVMVMIEEDDVDPALLETTVYTRVAGRDGTVFHTSRACAPGVARRTECTLEEAIDANRKPCPTCVGDEIREVYEEVFDGVA